MSTETQSAEEVTFDAYEEALSLLKKCPLGYNSEILESKAAELAPLLNEDLATYLHNSWDNMLARDPNGDLNILRVRFADDLARMVNAKSILPEGISLGGVWHLAYLESSGYSDKLLDSGWKGCLEAELALFKGRFKHYLLKKAVVYKNRADKEPAFDAYKEAVSLLERSRSGSDKLHPDILPSVARGLAKLLNADLVRYLNRLQDLSYEKGVSYFDKYDRKRLAGQVAAKFEKDLPSGISYNEVWQLAYLLAASYSSLDIEADFENILKLEYLAVRDVIRGINEKAQVGSKEATLSETITYHYTIDGKVASKEEYLAYVAKQYHLNHSQAEKVPLTQFSFDPEDHNSVTLTRNHIQMWLDGNGEIHRDGDLPAIVCKNGWEYWYQNGSLSRKNGKPASVKTRGAMNPYYYNTDQNEWVARLAAQKKFGASCLTLPDYEVERLGKIVIEGRSAPPITKKNPSQDIPVIVIDSLHTPSESKQPYRVGGRDLNEREYLEHVRDQYHATHPYAEGDSKESFSIDPENPELVILTKSQGKTWLDNRGRVHRDGGLPAIVSSLGVSWYNHGDLITHKLGKALTSSQAANMEKIRLSDFDKPSEGGYKAGMIKEFIKVKESGLNKAIQATTLAARALPSNVSKALLEELGTRLMRLSSATLERLLAETQSSVSYENCYKVVCGELGKRIEVKDRELLDLIQKGDQGGKLLNAMRDRVLELHPTLEVNLKNTRDTLVQDGSGTLQGLRYNLTDIRGNWYIFNYTGAIVEKGPSPRTRTLEILDKVRDRYRNPHLSSRDLYESSSYLADNDLDEGYTLRLGSESGLTTYYSANGKLHRTTADAYSDSGPAVESKDGLRVWVKNGKVTQMEVPSGYFGAVDPSKPFECSLTVDELVKLVCQLEEPDGIEKHPAGAGPYRKHLMHMSKGELVKKLYSIAGRLRYESTQSLPSKGEPVADVKSEKLSLLHEMRALVGKKHPELALGSSLNPRGTFDFILDELSGNKMYGIAAPGGGRTLFDLQGRIVKDSVGNSGKSEEVKDTLLEAKGSTFIASPLVEATVSSGIKEVNRRLADGIPKAYVKLIPGATPEQEAFLASFLSSPVGTSLLNLAEYGATTLADAHVGEGKGKELHSVAKRALEVGAYESLMTGTLRCIGEPMSKLTSLWGGSVEALLPSPSKASEAPAPNLRITPSNSEPVGVEELLAETSTAACLY